MRTQSAKVLMRTESADWRTKISKSADWCNPAHNCQYQCNCHVITCSTKELKPHPLQNTPHACTASNPSLLHFKSTMLHTSVDASTRACICSQNCLSVPYRRNKAAHAPITPAWTHFHGGQSRACPLVLVVLRLASILSPWPQRLCADQDRIHSSAAARRSNPLALATNTSPLQSDGWCSYMSQTAKLSVGLSGALTSRKCWTPATLRCSAPLCVLRRHSTE